MRVKIIHTIFLFIFIYLIFHSWKSSELDADSDRIIYGKHIATIEIVKEGYKTHPVNHP